MGFGVAGTAQHTNNSGYDLGGCNSDRRRFRDNTLIVRENQMYNSMESGVI